jgi:hypothetical protein
MDPLAWVVIAVYVVLNATVFHFQRFTLSLARRIVWADNGSQNPRDIAQIQTLITPVKIGLLGWLGYPFLVLACFVAFLAWGWPPVIGLIIWAFAVSAVIDFVWPLPTRAQSLGLVKREISSGMTRLTLANQTSSPEFSMYSQLLIETWLIDEARA